MYNDNNVIVWMDVDVFYIYKLNTKTKIYLKIKEWFSLHIHTQ